MFLEKAENKDTDFDFKTGDFREMKVNPISCVPLVHACNPTWEARIGKITVRGHLGQIVCKIPSQNNQNKMNKWYG
jgi:hypothetical protein